MPGIKLRIESDCLGMLLHDQGNRLGRQPLRHHLPMTADAPEQPIIPDPRTRQPFPDCPDRAKLPAHEGNGDIPPPPHLIRLVVILISGLLLVAALYLSLSALVNMRDGAKPGENTPKVAPDQIVTEITRTQPNSAASLAKPAVQAPQSPVDPNQAHYERAASTVVAFVSQYGRGEEVPKEGVIGVMKDRAELHPTPELVKAFAMGLPGMFEQVLSDKKVIDLVNRPDWRWPLPGDDVSQYGPSVGRSPIWVVNTTLDKYLEEFKQQAEQTMAEEESEREREAARKQHATQSLYMAGGVFGAFLLLALLAIIVRVERNLRPLSHLADKAREAK